MLGRVTSDPDRSPASAREARVRRIAKYLGIGLFLGAAYLAGHVTTLPLSWWDQWLKSPGFGGVAAVAAAGIAFGAATLAARSSREQAKEDRDQRTAAERKSQWWSRAQWALDLLKDNDSAVRAMGLRVLAALGESQWAGEHEGDIIDAATQDALDAEPETVGRVALRMASDDDPDVSRRGVEILAAILTGDARAEGDDFEVEARSVVEAWLNTRSESAGAVDDAQE